VTWWAYLCSYWDRQADAGCCILLCMPVQEQLRKSKGPMHQCNHSNFSASKRSHDAQTHEWGGSAVYSVHVFSFQLTVTWNVYMREICFHAGLRIKQTQQRWAVTSKEATCRWVEHHSELLSEEKCIDPACSRDRLGPGDQWNSLMKYKVPTLSEQNSYQKIASYKGVHTVNRLELYSAVKSFISGIVYLNLKTDSC
jgi:hypothetical protein